MPTYQYQCKNCGNEFEEFQSITEPPLVHCPKCNTDNLARVMGSGVNLIFKGSGFYGTDYKKSGPPPPQPEKKKKKDTPEPPIPKKNEKDEKK
jgi:putative FmdB family regulatory protein